MFFQQWSVTFVNHSLRPPHRPPLKGTPAFASDSATGSKSDKPFLKEHCQVFFRQIRGQQKHVFRRFSQFLGTESVVHEFHNPSNNHDQQYMDFNLFSQKYLIMSENVFSSFSHKMNNTWRKVNFSFFYTKKCDKLPIEHD